MRWAVSKELKGERVNQKDKEEAHSKQRKTAQRFLDRCGCCNLGISGGLIVWAKWMKGGTTENDITETRRVQMIYDSSQQTTAYDDPYKCCSDCFVNNPIETGHTIMSVCLCLLTCYNNGSWIVGIEMWKAKNI